MGNNTFNIVNYFKLIILKGSYIIFGIISFLLFAFGVKKTTAKCIYELMGIDQEIALILFAIGIVSSLIILNFYYKVRCIIGSINFNEKDIKLSAKNTENEVNYDECIINNKKLAVLDVENSLNPGYST